MLIMLFQLYRNAQCRLWLVVFQPLWLTHFDTHCFGVFFQNQQWGNAQQVNHISRKSDLHYETKDNTFNMKKFHHNVQPKPLPHCSFAENCNTLGNVSKIVFQLWLNMYDC